MPRPDATGLRALVTALALLGAGLIVPAAVTALPILAAVHLVGQPWSWLNPWSWLALLVIVVAVTLSLAHPVASLFRSIFATRMHVTFDPGFRSLPEPIRLATGFWWNGVSYERSRDDALSALRRRRVIEPAFWREVRWVAVAVFDVVPLALTGPAGLPVVVRVAERWLRPPRDAGPSTTDLLRQRADLTASHNAEIRRIERDLHDGAQARLVAVGLDLAGAERLMTRDPDRARDLVRSAREGTGRSLVELRELVHGVYPPVLLERGLVEALRAMALDSPLSVSVDADDDELGLESPTQAALYFSVAELLTNAARHSGADRASVEVVREGPRVRVVVCDTGEGGVVERPDGGLAGIRRRLAPFDGRLTLESPDGGPTRATVTVPCG